MKTDIDEYLARNLIVAKSYGVTGGIEACLKRLNQNKNSPKWLTEILNNELIKSIEITKEVVKHRNELRPVYEIT